MNKRRGTKLLAAQPAAERHAAYAGWVARKAAFACPASAKPKQPARSSDAMKAVLDAKYPR